MKQVLEDFYILSSLLDDDYELIVDFILSKTETRLKKAQLKRLIENANYDYLKNEINICLDMKTNIFKSFKTKWYSLHQNETLFEDI